ncbi:hypothetical protein [Novosphingobium sp. BW1]|uniref:hypothetical protein n=1 Tax=Novosphingobium sp. BW1 TaxID=2592621 RepID=UPI0011DEF76B|nr:hypothetical protein [Novosphingobium sp. BW1]TYC91545.1 hypothetical protein FMM79_04655 [Novosphingobium sp. BW1]
MTGRWRAGETVTGDDARRIVADQIEQHSAGLHAALAKFDRQSAFSAWFETIRAVEELINLPRFGLKEPWLWEALLDLPLDMRREPRRFRVLHHYIVYQFGEAFASRLTSLLLQTMAVGMAFASHRIESTRGAFQSIGSAIDYFQSRRRHLVSLLYTLPGVASGQQSVPQIDTLNQFLPLVEINGATLTGLYQKAMLAEVFKDYTLQFRDNDFCGSHEFPMLDRMHLEPERTSIIDMQQIDPATVKAANLEPVSSARLFSAAELRNDIRLMETAYAEFDLAGSEFRFAALFARHIADLAEDDYWVRFSRRKFERIASALRLPKTLRQALIHRPGSYTENTNSYAPLIEIDGQLTGTVALLSRFLYYWRNVCLYKNRRYQIRSGYIFEKAVSEELEQQGFSLTPVKRINHKEFDVVTIREGIIFNIQCKNNMVDVTKLEADVRLFARYNRARSASYERALRKEVNRESLLLKELGLARVEHLVVSRFPVATDNPRVISYSRIGDIGPIAAALARHQI